LQLSGLSSPWRCHRPSTSSHRLSNYNIVCPRPFIEIVDAHYSGALPHRHRHLHALVPTTLPDTTLVKVHISTPDDEGRRGIHLHCRNAMNPHADVRI